jgi:hypothetical protein
MTQRNTVVPETMGVTEEEFHAAWLTGLSRADKNVGRRVLAFVMEITTKQVKNIFDGAATHPKRMWDALAADPTALDDIAEKYGKKIVDRNAVSTVDDAIIVMTRLAAKMAEVIHPDSPGGRAITHCEYLDAEALMREAHAVSGAWLEKCGDIRAPRAVK